MKPAIKVANPILDKDGYEETPPDIMEAMEAAHAAGPLPVDFLPPPAELVLKTRKKSTTLRLDADVVDWFQSMGKGYQTKINAVLRSYKASHTKRA